MSNVRTRIAPSPTGIAHIGTAYMALFNYAFAKKYGGEFIIRIEDTDRHRFVEGAEAVIFDSMKWLRIPYTEASDIGGPHAPYRQSERLPLYKEAVETLLNAGHAYYCFCSAETLEVMRSEQQLRKETPRYDRRCLRLSKEDIETRLTRGDEHVVRMQLPDNEVITWEDLIRGHVEINTKELDDQVLVKSDGFPTYHLAVVVDDHAMEITHVIRGEEWISSAPKHLLLYRFFGWEAPALAHMPLLRNPDKSKMSKRKNDVSIPSYKEKGYLPEALRNYLCLLGWSHPEEKDLFSLEEFIETFTIERMQKTGPIFDVEKLNWMNGMYIRQIEPTKLAELIRPYLEQAGKSITDMDQFIRICTVERDRLHVLSDMVCLIDMYLSVPEYDSSLLVWKKADTADAKVQLTGIKHLLESFSEDLFTHREKMEETIKSYISEHGLQTGNVLWPTRAALSGTQNSPSPFELLWVFGKEESLKRIEHAITLLENGK